jgi:hypothetical protein
MNNVHSLIRQVAEKKIMSIAMQHVLPLPVMSISMQESEQVFAFLAGFLTSYKQLSTCPQTSSFRLNIQPNDKLEPDP